MKKFRVDISGDIWAILKGKNTMAQFVTCRGQDITIFKNYKL